MRRTAIVSLSLALCLAACQAPHSTRPETKPPTTTAAMSKNAYPAAKTVAQVDDYHGTKVADPYR